MAIDIASNHLLAGQPVPLAYLFSVDQVLLPCWGAMVGGYFLHATSLKSTIRDARWNVS